MKLSLKPACPDCGKKSLWLGYIFRRQCSHCKTEFYITKMSILSCLLVFIAFVGGAIAVIINEYLSTIEAYTIFFVAITMALIISSFTLRMISKKTNKELNTPTKPTLLNMYITEVVLFSVLISCIILLLYISSRAVKLFVPKFILDPYPPFSKAVMWLTPATINLTFVTIIIVSLGYLLFGIILFKRSRKKKLFSSGIRFFETSYKLIAFFAIFAFAGLLLPLMPFAFKLSEKTGDMLIQICDNTLWILLVVIPVLMWFFKKKNQHKQSLSFLNKKLTRLSLINPFFVILVLFGELIAIRKIVQFFFMEYGETGSPLMEFIAGENLIYGILSFLVIMFFYFIFLVAGFRNRMKFYDRISFCLYMNKFLFAALFLIICLLATLMTSYLTMFTLCMCGGDGAWNQETYPHITYLSWGLTILTAVFILSQNIHNRNKCKWIYLTGILIFAVFYLPVNKKIHPPGEKIGFINKQGMLVIKPKFTYAGNFKSGLCNVILPKYSFCTPAGFINKKGEWVISPKFYSTYPSSDGFSRIIVYEDNSIFYNRFVNKEGKFLETPQYISARSFSDGLAWVEAKAGEYGYINTKGQLVIKDLYSKARDFSDGLAWVEVKVNLKGKVEAIKPPKKIAVNDEESMFSEEDLFKPGFDHKMVTFIDKSGNFAIKNKDSHPMLFLEAGNFSEGLAWVKINTNSGKSPPDASMFTNSTKYSKVGFINKSGDFVVKAKFHYAKDFKEGMAPVKLRGAWGFVNKKGELAVKLKYAEVYGFSEGLARVNSKHRYGFIDKSGKEVIPIIYDEARDFSEGLAAVQKDGLWGYIDKTGKFVIKPQFHSAQAFSEGLAAVGVKMDY